MTDEERRAAFEQFAKEELGRRQAEQVEIQQKLREAAMWAQRTQAEINAQPRQQYSVIVAVDEEGAFSKDGKIPWHYPEDFKWFQSQTKGHICVMGRTTYDDITNHLGDKAAESVLPGRRCFVVTSTPLPQNNATAVSSISEVDKYLTPEDAEQGKIVFFIGGERIYREGIAKASTAFVTIVNKNVEGDRHFPTNYLMKHFTVDKVYKHESSPDLRFTIWKRNP